MRKKLLGVYYSVLLLAVFGLDTAYAAGESNPFVGKSSTGGTCQTLLCNPLKGGITSLPELLTVVLNILVQIGIPVIVLAYIWAGFTYVTAFGDTSKIKNAHNILWYTTIGAGVLLGAKAIAMIIQGTLVQLQ